jgi:branched-chain amino acid transport system ATP-binding protein
MSLLQIDRLTAGYGETVILEDVSLALAAGDTVALLGRNGVGKTTLLRTLLGLTTVHGGTITFAGDDALPWPSHQRARRGFGLVPQEREIFPSLTVHENLAVAVRPVPNGRWSIDAVYALFPRLAERRRNMGHQLSGGEQQMLAIGRALVGHPKLLLLDEPFEGLAPIIVDQLVLAFERLRDSEGMGIVLVEQHAELALELTRRAVVLDRGRIAWSGSSDELRAQPALLHRLIGLDAAA